MQAAHLLTHFCRSVLLASALTQAALGQGGAAAQLSGLVTDPTGAVVVGAQVTVRNAETGLSQSTQTTREGHYVLANLPPGFYEVVIAAPGFVRLRQSGVELTVGQKATLNISLRVAGTSEEIMVMSGAALVEPDRTEQSQVIEERRIENLPINGRQFLDFILLTPNVDVGRSNIGNQFRPGEPSQIDLSFAGLEEIASQVTVDGADNTNRTFGRSRSTPSQEAVREFRVVTSGYTADLGPAAGAVINIVTKSGTNALRGSAYYFFRDDSLDARNLLAPAGFDELRQNQFGGTLGGPLVRDRLFLFGNYEGQRRQESPFYSSLLLDNLGAINTVKQSLGLPPEVLEGKLRRNDYDSLTVRGDHQSTGNHLLSLIYRFRDDRAENLGTAAGQISAPSNFRHADIGDHALVFNATSNLSSRLANQGLFQFARRSFDFPSVGFEPYIQIPYTLDLGRHTNASDATREMRFEFGDTLSYTRGAHNWKFGGKFYHLRFNIFLDAGDPGFGLFPNLDAFLGRPPFPPFPFAVIFGFAQAPDGARPPAPLGFTRSANLPAFAALTRDRSSLTHYALFAQDQWRVTPRLTLNYGLRWDVDDRPREFYDGYHKAVQPRVGVAYSLLADQLVLRVGGGVYQGVGTPAPSFTAGFTGKTRL
jgi:outer membrane receptor protein involved in Fe transport